MRLDVLDSIEGLSNFHKGAVVDEEDNEYTTTVGVLPAGRRRPCHAFQACSFNHSDISPCLSNQLFTG